MLYLKNDKNRAGRTIMRKERVWTQQRADFLLILITMAWGSSYLLMKFGLGSIRPFCLILLRFGIAFLAVVPFFFRRLRKTTRRVLGISAILGLLLFLCFAAMLIGLEQTSASSAAFLNASAVVMVPVFHAILLRKLPEKPVILGSLITMTGIGFLSLDGGFVFRTGDIFCLLSAAFYAGHILLTNYASRKTDSLLIGIWQLFFAALYAGGASLLLEEASFPGSAAGWAAILGLALICSAFGLVMQSVAQAHTTPEHTSLIFSLEPVFSAALSFLLTGEMLSAMELAGAALVLVGVGTASALTGSRREHRPGLSCRQSEA
jgi:drug/metabolite transporter (DMT)-like permease